MTVFVLMWLFYREMYERFAETLICGRNNEMTRLQVVPVSLSPSCVTRKKTARKKWPREV